MTRIKSPGLLIRISHLIIIQIVFIFSALALVLFYPTGNNSVTDDYSHQRDNVFNSTSILANMIRLDSSGIHIDSQVVAEAERCLKSDKSLLAVGILYRDMKSGKDSLINLTQKGEAPQTLQIATPIAKSDVELLKSSSSSIISVLSSAGEYLIYYIRPQAAGDDYLIQVTARNTPAGALRNNQAEIIFLLFLISALISLLIINLIFKGIKRPLSRLIQAFEKTASGEQDHLAEEVGDKDFQRLAAAFNKMSHSLSEKQNKLSIANTELLKANKSLNESESILTALVDYSPDAIIVTDLDDQVIIYNQQAAKDFGYGQTDMLRQKDPQSLLPARITA